MSIRPLRALTAAVPRGGTLPPTAFEARHRVLLVVLALHVPLLAAVALAAGVPATHAVLHPLPVVAFALLGARLPGRRLRSIAAAVGLLTCSALLVHTLDGLIEAHFHFFVVLIVLAVYEDWAVYGLSLAYVVLHHGLAGTGLPYEVFDHPGAANGADAWRWAAVHGLFFALAVAASVSLWKLNEQSRDAALGELRGRLHAEGVADALARGLRPDALPAVPGVELAARYAPGGGRVGGDWYDVIVLDDGRVLAALGDVGGHGPDAAGLSARLRHVLRAYAEDGAGPADLLGRLDRTVADGMATAVCMLIDPARCELTYAVAGHVPPLLRGGDGAVRLLEAGRSAPLADLGVPRPQAVEALGAGDTIVLFSDGLIERRDEHIDRSLARLAASVGRIGGAPDELAAHVVDEVGAPGGTADDVALLVVRFAAAAELPAAA